jgi:hypothetical protein
MWVKKPAAIISGIITMSIAAIEVPAALRTSSPCSTQLPSFAPSRSERLKDWTSSSPKK